MVLARRRVPVTRSICHASSAPAPVVAPRMAISRSSGALPSNAPIGAHVLGDGPADHPTRMGVDDRITQYTQPCQVRR